MNHETVFDGQLQNSKPEQSIRNESLGTVKGKTESADRPIVRITSFRTRLLDTDNLTPKYLLDALRYAGAVFDDREKDIRLEVSQVKVVHRNEEKTEIEIEYP